MALRSSNKASSSTGGTITAAPPGVQAHDYLGATYLCDTNTGTLNVPAGWTNDQLNTWGSGAPDGGRQMSAFKADASGSDAFGFSDTAGGASNAVITAAWSGRDNASPHSTARVKTLDTNSNTSAISATITGITALAGDDIAVFKATDQTAAAARWTFSPITGYTEQQDGVATDWVSGIALDTLDNASAGATGNFATTITRGAGTGNSGYAAIVVAIKAAAGGATPFAAALSSATFQFSPQSITRLTTVVSALSSATFQFTAQSLARLTTVVNALSSATFQFTGQALTRINDWIAALSSATFQFSPQSLTQTVGYLASLSSATFQFTGQALTRINAYRAQLTAATFQFVGQALSYTAAASSAVVSDWLQRARRRRR